MASEPNRILRIAHIVNGRCNPDASNGVDIAALGLAQAQVELGQRVAIFSITQKQHIPLGDVEHICVTPGLTSLFSSKLHAALESWRPDVVHLHSVFIPGHFLLRLWLDSAGIPYAVSPHGGLSPFVLHGRKSFLKWLYTVIIQRRLLARAAFVHAAGDREQILGYGVKSPLVIAPNGIRAVTSPGFDEAAGQGSEDGLKILFIGRLDIATKGLDALVEGFALADIRGATLLIVGPSVRDGANRLRQIAVACGCFESVVVCGRVPAREKERLLRSAHVYIQTSRTEASPMSVLEAATYALPLIVSSPADPGGLFTACGAAFQVESTPASIAAALRSIASMDSDSRKYMGLKARRAAIEQYSWATPAQVIIDAYRRYAVPQ